MFSPLLNINTLIDQRFSIIVRSCFQRYLLQSCCMWEEVNPFLHTTILQQTTWNIFCPKIENLYNWMDNWWLKVGNIVAKGEIARFEQFLLLVTMFSKSRLLHAEASESVHIRERVNVYVNFELTILLLEPFVWLAL